MSRIIYGLRLRRSVTAYSLLLSEITLLDLDIDLTVSELVHNFITIPLLVSNFVNDGNLG